MSEEFREWGRTNVRANRFLQDSASFYVSARRLLIPGSATGLMPGLVCGAYALEQVMKAALEYAGTTPPIGPKGHDLVHLAGLLPPATNVDAKGLALFGAYFQSRYFDNEKGADILNSGDYATMDNLYYSVYQFLDVPLAYHCRMGLLGVLFADDQEHKRLDRKALKRDNAHFDYYADLYRRSAEALGNTN